MSSRRSVERPPEFFVDRSLGKVMAEQLRAAGWILHLIADAYPDDAAAILDEDWIAEGNQRGWALLTKDKAIRYRAEELASLGQGRLFCLANGNMTTAHMVDALTDGRRAIERAARRPEAGFWHVHADGRLRRMWP